MGEQIKFTVGGAEFLLSKEDVELKLKAVEPENVREVYIEVNGTRFPIKQALACATGLLRGTFTTHDAMRVFRKLAFSVGTESAIEIDTMPERIYTMLKSLAQFDKLHLRGVIRGLLAKTDRDNCFIGNYYRAVANIESLLSLKSARDLQAISMVARGLFELAVDTKLISIIPDAVKKIVTFSDVEKLRAARKIVKYKAANPSAALDATVHDTFITNNARRIDAERAAVWPGMKKVEHWSARNLADRVALLKAPFDEIYEVEYPRLSWYVHSSGLTGFVDLEARTFNQLAGNQNRLAGESYVIILTAVIDEFGLEKANPRIKTQLKLAKIMPFTTTPEETLELKRIERELLS
jgi:hypothetical protein